MQNLQPDFLMFYVFQNFLVSGLKMSATESAGFGSHECYLQSISTVKKKKVSKSKNKSTCKFSVWLLNKWLVDNKQSLTQPFCIAIKFEICIQEKF